MEGFSFPKQVKIIIATMTLHNYIRRHSSQDSHFVIEENLGDISSGMEMDDDGQEEDHGYVAQEMEAIRNEIAQSLMSARGTRNSKKCQDILIEHENTASRKNNCPLPIPKAKGKGKSVVTGFEIRTLMGSPKRKKKQTPEAQFHSSLTLCSKNKDLITAISLYESAVTQNTRLNQHHFNTLLYLCSNSVTDPALKQSALEYGFRMFDHMLSTEVVPNEATITAVARLAAAKGDGDYAFELVKGMEKYTVLPRLRTCDPALFCFCEKLEADKAYVVEEHMNKVGVSVEEPEIAALLKVSAETGRGERVYDYMHKLRNVVRCVSESTAKIIEDWFRDGRASEVGEANWDSGRVKEAVLRNGGGWHGQGWVGKGEWDVQRANVDSESKCCSCGEHLVCVDIDCAETDRFAQSVAALAMEREVKSNFSEFQDWLDKHADYEAIVDGANIGLYQQNFADGGFSLPQLDAVVKELHNRSGEKWPLVVLHNRRYKSLMENPSHRKVVQEWMDKGILYTTPSGSNDDWYWLYAAVKLKCLLVTNDEMRDHIFELLGNSFFLKWKERHQVRYTFSKGNLKLLMPPPYSSVIQESESGSWHVPVADASCEEPARTWLCITRPSVTKASGGVLLSESALPNSCTSQFVTRQNDKTTSKTGKRKERSPSPSHLMT